MRDCLHATQTNGGQMHSMRICQFLFDYKPFKVSHSSSFTENEAVNQSNNVFGVFIWWLFYVLKHR